MHLSYLQRRMWWLNETNKKAVGFNIPILFKSITTPNHVWLNHITHHTIQLGLENYKLSGLVDLKWEWTSNLSLYIDIVTCKEMEQSTICQSLSRHHFDLSQEAPIRIHLLLTEQKSYLLFVFCHIVFDGSAAALFIASLEKNCRKSIKYLLDEPNSQQYENMFLVKSNSITYWEIQLQQLNEGLLAAPLPQQEEVMVFEFPAELFSLSRQYCRRTRVNLSALMLSIWAQWLMQYFNKSAVTIGTASENRTTAEKKNILHLYVSVFPLVITDCSPKEIDKKYQSVKKFPYVPYEDLVKLDNFTKLSGWFDFYFGFHHWPKTNFNIKGIDWEICTFTQGISRYPLSMDIFLLGEKTYIKIERDIYLNGMNNKDIYSQYLTILQSTLQISLMPGNQHVK
ncbi:condensation domain-containing protein [Xenorhabdus khoisanae]|uniref:condensation domain-containing protein n=1 Tax=Xenorhabdus khoisanae TaxID=880157 RepID=UPI00235879BB|nr:condensation domain-containing protein [Xenorhabdus khoisanae]MDC9613813.1 condensation domain-containing protein [Xenorhabdus khoisanae]